MRFPFVPRGVYEDAMGLLRAERAQNATLIDVIVKMKVAGSSIPRDPATMRPLEALPPDPFEEAIAENKHAAANPRIRAALSDYVDREKRKRTRPEKILETLRTWSTVRAEDDTDDADEDNDTIALVDDDDVPEARMRKVSA